MWDASSRISTLNKYTPYGRFVVPGTNSVQLPFKIEALPALPVVGIEVVPVSSLPGIFVIGI